MQAQQSWSLNQNRKKGVAGVLLSAGGLVSHHLAGAFECCTSVDAFLAHKQLTTQLRQHKDGKLMPIALNNLI